MAKSTVAIRFTGDTADLKRSLGQMDGKMGGLGQSAAKMGKALAVGFGVGVAALAVLGKSAIDAGSDLNETLSKSNTVFKENAKEVETWANTAATAFGQSKNQALESASSFGNMFLQLGIGGKVATKMSKSMTELASDFASFHNADITEVLTAQQAAFRGEYDAVQRFVPTINAAAVEQKALALKLAKTTKELTPQHKALATEALLLEGAGDAMGDFARTSDGLANKQRILTARFEDVKAKIGQALIPIALSLAGVFSDKVLPIMESFGAWLGEKLPVALAVAGPILAAVFGWFSDAALKVGEFIEKAGPPITAWVEDVLATMASWWDDHGPTILTVIETLKTGVETAFSGLITAGKFVVDHWDDFKLAAGAMVLVVVPHFVALGAAAVASAAVQAGAWLVAKAASLGAAIAHSFHVLWMIAGWLLLGIKAGIHAAIVVASWVATAVASRGATTSHGVAVAAQVAGWGTLSAAAARHSLAIAASWARAAGPFGLAIGAGVGVNKLVGKKTPFAGPFEGGGFNPFKGMSLDFGFEAPWGDDGGVMPGPRGKHSLAWVAGGETLIPTHKPGVSIGADRPAIHIDNVTLGNGATVAELAAELTWMWRVAG